MKGLAVEYILLFFLLVIVVFVGIGIINFFYKQAPKTLDRIVYNVTFQCIEFNDTAISFNDFKDILYGFSTGQCNNFYATSKNKITIDDIKRVSSNWDESIQVIQIDECKLPTINSHTIYVSFNENEIKSNSDIYLKRKEVKDSDILICSGAKIISDTTTTTQNSPTTTSTSATSTTTTTV